VLFRSSLIASAFAYGRVELIQKCLGEIERATGPDLSDFCCSTAFASKQKHFKDFKYRFNDGTDLALLCEGAGKAIKVHGSLETMVFTNADKQEPGIKPEILALSKGLRDTASSIMRSRKSFEYLVSCPSSGSACKRLNLMMRWLVRPDDGIDLGIWTRIRPSELLVPVDTHIAQVARRLKLTKRSTPDWRMAEEITSVLRLLSPDDPVKYDFALCQDGMADFRKGS
jgi:uncharacterized protein (TIGR02757 family)